MIDAYPDVLKALDVWNSAVSSIGTNLYVRLRRANASGDLRLQGTVRGPFSQTSQTLPTTFQLVDLGGGDSVLAKAHVTDPCAWTAQVPSIYRLNATLTRTHEPVAEFELEIGIRNLSTVGQSLCAEKRVVLRGADIQRTNWTDLAEWRAAQATILALSPDTALCQHATQEGVPMVARLTDASSCAEEIFRLSRFPSVQVVWLDFPPGSASSMALENDMLPKTLEAIDLPHLLLAGNASDVAHWDQYDILVARPGDLADEDVLTMNKPMIAVRPLETKVSPSGARAACERLQRDLAPACDLAGYFV